MNRERMECYNRVAMCTLALILIFVDCQCSSFHVRMCTARPLSSFSISQAPIVLPLCD